MTEATSDVAVAVTASDSPVDDGAKTECDQNSSKLFNKQAFSHLTIKFSGREICAHRIIVCRGSKYFNSLCGPDSRFAESDTKEITLHDDDPDPLEAMLRHIYNYWLRQPSMSMTVPERTHFYCNIVVVADKYRLPLLADAGRKALNTLVISIEDPAGVLTALRLVTEHYSEYPSLDGCATNLACPQLSELATVAEFPAWLATQTEFLLGIVQDAAKLRSLTELPVQKYKTVKKFKCTRALCGRFLLDREEGIPRCHGNAARPDGVMYYEDP